MPRRELGMEMERANCILCGSNNSKMLLRAKDYRFKVLDCEFNLVQCQNCGLIFIDPRPTKREMIHFYPRDYYADNAIFLNLANKLIQVIKAKKVMSFKKRGRILDVGFGNGELLLYFKERGWEVYGVDTSEHAYRLAREKLGQNIFNCELKEVSFPDLFFDVVMLNHALEHMYNPNEELKEIRRILKDDGVLVLSMPNIDSLQFKMTKRYWFHLDVPRHLYHFSPATIRKLLEINGFKVIELYYPWYAFPLDLYHSLTRIHHYFKAVFLASLLLKIVPQFRGTMEIIAKKN
jgi:ubiquinone/menaquinone biosynthesis C-methylase UbiE